MTDIDFMRRALDVAWQGIEKGEMPFGACVVKRGQIVTVAHNNAKATLDTTAHAEMQAVREATRKLKTLELTGCHMFATCEPCPMCFAACQWAKIGRIVYACRIEDAARSGIGQIPIASRQMKQMGHYAGDLVGDFLREQGLKLFADWSLGLGRQGRS